MEAKAKAKELINKFTPHTRDWTGVVWIDNAESAKECALIAVDEILVIAKYLDTYSIEKMWREEPDYETNVSYWQQVKQEINSL